MQRTLKQAFIQDRWAHIDNMKKYVIKFLMIVPFFFTSCDVYHILAYRIKNKTNEDLKLKIYEYQIE